MAKELTFSSATLGWRFSHTEIFLQHFIKQWELLQDVALKNLDEYWNINAATGDWLHQLGQIFDVPQSELIGDDAFVLDIDHLDDPDVILDGTLKPIADDLFRKIILVRSASTMKLFSIKTIADVLYEVFGSDQIKVEIIENIGLDEQPKDMWFRLILTFKSAEMVRFFVGLNKTLPVILIGKPMGVGYDLIINYDPNI